MLISRIVLAFIGCGVHGLLTQQRAAKPARTSPRAIEPQQLGDDHTPPSGKVEVSSRDDTTACGVNSPNGNVSCGMNICCSHYGYCGIDDAHCSSSGPTPCQEGFGSCQVAQPFQCDPSAESAKQRTIGYYQGANVHPGNRACNQIYPSDIKADGYTHLYWAFAEFDPSSFEVVPQDSRDAKLYTNFTSFAQQKNISPWISLGGYDFTTNNPHAWSDMVSTAKSRSAFISSLVKFMTDHQFEGVDIDWEYPVTSDRGGRQDDMVSLVTLLKEMRAKSSFGKKFGISVTLAPDIAYLQYFDAKGLLAHADCLNFMSYDLHTLADVNNGQGNFVLGQTDLNDIEIDVAPLWFDLAQADMARVNLGLAMYGRGYKLSDPACNQANGDCRWSAGSKPGACTNTAGVMSKTEIDLLIKSKNLKPTALGVNSTMKQITFDDQWIGYDDEDSIAQKIEYASAHCFGGTLAWSLDFDSGTGASTVPATSTDGTCGSGNGGTICPSGQCCSGHGYCGTGSAYCGSGCYSGDCIQGGITTDGSCGVGNSHMTCGGQFAGCCSSAGYCGTTSDYCGYDEQTAYSSNET